MSVNREALTNYAYVRGLVISFLFLSSSGIMGREDHLVVRVLVTLVSLWGVYYAARLGNRKWLALLAGCAVLLNPLWHPHHMGRLFWIVIDLTVIGVLGCSIVGLAPAR